MPEMKHVAPGDPLAIQATTWNAMMDAAQRMDKEFLGGDKAGKRNGAIAPATLIMVRNDTGGDLDAFGVVAIGTTTPLVSVTDNPQLASQQPFLVGTVPAATTDPFAVALDPIPQGGYGRAATLGVIACKVNVVDTGDGFASPTASDATQLTSGTSGPAKIIWKESGTGTKWALVLLTGQGAGFVGAQSVASSDTTIPSANKTEVSFDTLSFDSGGFWSAGSPTKLTVPEDGYYHVGCTVGWGTGGFNAITYIQAGGIPIASDVRALVSGIASNPQITISTIANMTAGGYFSVAGYQTTGANKIIAGSFNSMFWAYKIR